MIPSVLLKTSQQYQEVQNVHFLIYFENSGFLFDELSFRVNDYKIRIRNIIIFYGFLNFLKN